MDYKLPSGFDYDAVHTLELRVVGDLLTVTLDGKKLGDQRDTQLSEGRPAISGSISVTRSSLTKGWRN